MEKRRSEKGEGRKMLRCMQIPLVTFAFGLANGLAADAAAAGASGAKVDLDKFTFTIDTINRLRSQLLATGKQGPASTASPHALLCQ